jgi:hypothetical protein
MIPRKITPASAYEETSSWREPFHVPDAIRKPVRQRATPTAITRANLEGDVVFGSPNHRNMASAATPIAKDIRPRISKVPAAKSRLSFSDRGVIVPRIIRRQKEQ